MKKFLFVAALLAVSLSTNLLAGPKGECATIQDGVLNDKFGDPITTGFNDWGYNYQANMFSGYYCDSYGDADWCQEYAADHLAMKWNDAWLSNMDCDGDGVLDRHHGFDSYIGSGAWLTNHISGEYEGEYGEVCFWNYFTKIVAAPADAVKVDGIWYNADGMEIGPDIWGSFVTLLTIENDSCAGLHGRTYGSPVAPGLGKF